MQLWTITDLQHKYSKDWRDKIMGLNDMMENKTKPKATPTSKAKNQESKATPGKKTYLKLDTTGLDEYLNKITIQESVKKGIKVSKTAYIQNLIKQDMAKNKDII